METLRKLRNRWNSLPTWGKVVSILIVLNEVRGAFVAYWAVDNGAFEGTMPVSELAYLAAIVIVPAVALKVWKRRKQG